MSYLGVDVSRWQDPAALPWREWADRVTVALVQVTHGTVPEPHAAEHLAAASAAHVPVIGGYHWLMPGNALAQLARFVDTVDQHDACTFCALDVEEPGVTAADVVAWCSAYDADFHLPLLLYGNNALAAIVAEHPELRRYGVWWANYPAGKARISSPPENKSPSAPAGLRVVGWQFSGTGLLAPYDQNIDLSVWYSLPNGKTPMNDPVITHGPKLGIHSIQPGNTLPLVQRAVDAGWHWPVVKILHDASVCTAVKAISPQTLTICRYMPPSADDEGLQNVDTWSALTMQAWARRLIDLIFARTAAADLPHVDYWDVTNEPGAHGVSYYRALGLAFCELVREADRRGLRLSLPALPQGVPEWDEMVALVDTGLFGLMKKGGHIYDCHEGNFTDQPVDFGYGDVIPGGPHIEGAGSTNFRHRYLYQLLERRDERVPLVISEFYGGGRYSDPPADQLARFAWYDVRARAEPYLLAFLPFTINSDATWSKADYGPTYASAELWQYIAAEKDKPNGEPDMPNVTDADYAALVAANNQQAAILAKYKPAPAWKGGDVAVAVADPLIVYQNNMGTVHDTRHNYTADMNVIGVSTNVGETWLQVYAAPALFVRAADVKHKP